MARFSSVMAGLIAVCWAICWPLAAVAQMAVSASDGQGGDVIVVTLRPTAIVDQPIATVAEVASLQGGESWLRQRIAALDIAEVQRSGRPATVTRNQLALRIQLAGIDGRAFKVNGAAEVAIDIKAASLSEQDVIKTAQDAILRRFKVDIGDLEFRLLEAVHLPSVDIAPNDQIRLIVDTPPVAISAGKTRIDIGVMVNEQRRASVTVSAEVMFFRQVAVTTRRMEAGEAVLADSVRVERRPAGSNDQWLSYTEQLLGKHAMHTIAPGQTLTAEDLDQPAGGDEVVIKTRDSVKLIAVIGSLRLIASGEALEDGKIGQIIRIRNTESNRVVSGRVMARGTVEVDH